VRDRLASGNHMEWNVRKLEHAQIIKQVSGYGAEEWEIFTSECSKGLAACRTRDFRSNLATPVAVIELSVAP